MSHYQDPADAQAVIRSLARSGYSYESIATAYRGRTGQQLPAALAQELGFRSPVPAAPLPEGILTAEQTKAELDRIETLPRNQRNMSDQLMASWEYHAREGEAV